MPELTYPPVRDLRIWLQFTSKIPGASGGVRKLRILFKALVTLSKNLWQCKHKVTTIVSGFGRRVVTDVCPHAAVLGIENSEIVPRQILLWTFQGFS